MEFAQQAQDVAPGVDRYGGGRAATGDDRQDSAGQVPGDRDVHEAAEQGEADREPRRRETGREDDERDQGGDRHRGPEDPLELVSPDPEVAPVVATVAPQHD